MSKPKVPNTISDRKMAALRRRGQKAEPFNLTDRKQIKRRNIGRANLRQSRWN
jgi:hypothetical protein